MGFRFQDLMVDVLAAAGQERDEGCPHDTTHDQGCGAHTDDCPFDTTADQGEECPDPTMETCPHDTTQTIADGDGPEKKQQADLALLKTQLQLALAELR